MRGLTLFIMDLRECKGKEDELKRINKELANIRSKFKSTRLSGYDKKKYLCKLIFIFLLGHKCDLGHMVAVNLLLSNIYSEKQIGYLFISVVMGENHNSMPLIINFLKNDLFSANKFFQNLALQFVANNTTLDVTEAMAERVLDLLLFSNTAEFVKQTAALTLLQLLRKKQDLHFDEFKAKSIINLISHQHFGIMTASASLVDFLAKNSTSQFQSCLPYCMEKLSSIVTLAYTDLKEYTYYGTVAPWLTVKLIRILKNFPAPTQLHLKWKLQESLNNILDKAYKPIKLKRFTYANYAVIFEVISLIIQMEFDSIILYRAINILENALKHKESNIRCMALDMMTQLSNNETCLAKVKVHWEFILNILKKETDISIKKQAIDLLYIICDKVNVKPIIHEMLYFLEFNRDYLVDVILKAAALGEKFGTDSPWYVTTILNMLKLCGDIVDESMWYTLIKVIKKNDKIQKYAARASCAVLNENPCHDSVVKAAGYILGEFGYLIASDPESSHIQQLNILREKYSSCSHSARFILLTTFMKFINMYPDLKEEIQSILREKCNLQCENEEIQQRTVEYLKLSETASKGLLAITLGETPSCTRCDSSVVKTVRKQNSQRFDMEFVEKGLNTKNVVRCHSHCNLSLMPEFSNNNAVQVMRTLSYSSLYDATDTSVNPKLLGNRLQESYTSDTILKTLPVTFLQTPKISNFPSSEMFLHNLLFNETGVLFENSMIMIEIVCEFEQFFGRFHLKYINKSMCPLFDFAVNGNFSNIENTCLIRFKPCNSVLEVNGSIEQNIHLECLSDFSKKPSITLEFTYERQQQEIELLLPLTLNKFVEPSAMNEEDYSKRWQNFETVGQEIVQEFTPKHPMIYGLLQKKLKGFHVYLIKNLDLTNFYCAGIFHTRTQQLGFLVRLDQSLENKRYRSSVRSIQLSLCQTISDLLFDLL